MDPVNWEGEEGAPVESHRTLGERAWCLDDSMYCYRHIPCQCCMEASPDWIVCGPCAGEGYVHTPAETGFEYLGCNCGVMDGHATECPAYR